MDTWSFRNSTFDPSENEKNIYMNVCMYIPPRIVSQSHWNTRARNRTENLSPPFLIDLFVYVLI